jgi:hypothetical protein
MVKAFRYAVGDQVSDGAELVEFIELAVETALDAAPAAAGER